MCVRAFDDLQGPAAGVGDHLGHLGSLIARIGKDIASPCAAAD
jgi:hypothetical protein